MDHPSSHTTSPHQLIHSESVTDPVLLLEEGDLLGCIIEEVYLIIALDESSKLDADESDELASFVDLVEELECLPSEYCVIGCIILRVSSVNVLSLDMDFCSTYGVTGVLSMALAFSQSRFPDLPNSFCSSLTGI